MKNTLQNKKDLLPKQQTVLLKILEGRFKKNMSRHQGLDWAKVQERLKARTDKLWSLNEMERTGGEPDVIGSAKKTGEYIFFDCCPESPQGRRNVCYDRKGQASRKVGKPEGNTVDMAAAMGIELLTEEQYRQLQNSEEFDTRSSSWLKTPESIRELGGAIFADRRYNHVFVFHNGADSYYSSRGFRGWLTV